MKISYEDLQMWSITASNPMFREAFEIAEQILKEGKTPEIVWYGGDRATGGKSNGWIEVNSADGPIDLTGYKKFKQRNKKKKEKKK